MCCPPAALAAARSAGCVRPMRSWPGARWRGGSTSVRAVGRRSASAAIRRCRRCWRPSAPACRPLIHEQNAVLGRVNRLLARKVDAIATAYPRRRAARRRVTRPRRIWSAIRCATRCCALRDRPYPPLTEEGVFRVLVTGGSQGATVLSQVVPEGLGAAAAHFRRRMQVTQQCAARGYRGSPRQICRARHPGRSRHLYAPTCPSGWPGRISSSPAPAPRPSPS